MKLRTNKFQKLGQLTGAMAASTGPYTENS
jgi:hypothetical protein